MRSTIQYTTTVLLAPTVTGGVGLEMGRVLALPVCFFGPTATGTAGGRGFFRGETVTGGVGTGMDPV